MVDRPVVEAEQRIRVTNVQPLHEERFVFDEMLQGWKNQQLSRGNKAQSIERAQALITHFHEFTNRYPWEWDAGDVEDYFAHRLSGERKVALSTVRGYQSTIRLFCAYLTDARYDWGHECQRRFGTSPQQICHEWNTVHHFVDFEGSPGRRALTFDELETLFSAADGRVDSIRNAGRKGALAALRDAQLLKTIYAFGLRRAESSGLDVADLRHNPDIPAYGRFGAIEVRWGKGSNGSGPKRRTVLTVPEFDWVTEGLQQWMTEARPRYTLEPAGPLFLSERGTRISEKYIASKFAELRDEIGLAPELTLHSLRRSYVTHLIEFGYAVKFVQDQVGHERASTTAIYTDVGDDYRRSMVKAALASLYGEKTS